MAPKKRSGMDLLFHPKKKAGATRSSAPIGNSHISLTASSSQSSNSLPHSQSPQPQPMSEDEDDELKLPETSFVDYTVFSTKLNGWKYDVMKLDSRKPVDVIRWQEPVKLNRKDLRRDDPASTIEAQTRPMVGLDGKPVVGADGKVVMVDMDGKVVVEPGKEKEKVDKKGGKKKFQKKTRQVFSVPDEIRALRKEERYPWVLEDGTGKELWVAQLDDTSKSTTHALLLPAENNTFQFVPTHRHYKFQKKLKHSLPTDTAGVDAAYTMSQKRDPQQWLAQRTGRTISTATAATFKAESEGRSVDGVNSLVHSGSGPSLGPGGRKLKTVDKGSLFGDDDDDDPAAKRRRAKEYGEDADMDEMLYEDDFADDDDKVEQDGEDEEAKEQEERQKKEQIAANKTREGYMDHDDEDDDDQLKTKQEKRLERMLRDHEGNDAYESDDEEKNPYASSEESSDEEELLPTPIPLPVEEPVKQEPAATDSVAPASGTPAPASGLALPLGGHSIVAKRATSPKAPMKIRTNGIRSGSPLAEGSRATSPIPNGSRAGSPVAGSSQKKRKAPDDAASPASPTSPSLANGQPKMKKRKHKAPVGELTEAMVIDWIKNTAQPTTRDCILRFKPYLTDAEKKVKFTQMIKGLASSKDNVLELKTPWRDATPNSA